jgi:2-dehydropantoate 2-reductase
MDAPMETRRRYIVHGAGAVGAGIGGMLQASGRDVVLIARGAQLAALTGGGLTLALPSREIHLAVEAVASPRAIRFEARDVVLLCVKSQDTATALADLAASAPRSVPVVCAQNGVANEPRAAAVFERVYGLVVFSPIQFVEPGRVSIHAEPVLGGLDLGLHPEGTDDLAAEVVRDLAATGFDARLEPRIARLKYGKLLSNLGNALQALGGREALASPLPRALQEEAIACFHAAGIDFAPLDELYRMNGAVVDLPVRGATRGGGSSWQSLARGVGSIETDFLNGEIVRLGERCGVPTPKNRAVAALALRASAEKWPPERMTVAEIEAAIRDASAAGRLP